MTRGRKSRRRLNDARGAVLPGVGPAVEEAPAGPADEPDRSEDGAPGQLVYPTSDGAGRSDIERASEHKPGSIEGVPHATPTAGMASFEEPSSEGGPVIP